MHIVYLCLRIYYIVILSYHAYIPTLTNLLLWVRISNKQYTDNYSNFKLFVLQMLWVQFSIFYFLEKYFNKYFKTIFSKYKILVPYFHTNRADREFRFRVKRRVSWRLPHKNIFTTVAPIPRTENRPRTSENFFNKYASMTSTIIIIIKDKH